MPVRKKPQAVVVAGASDNPTGAPQHCGGQQLKNSAQARSDPQAASASRRRFLGLHVIERTLSDRCPSPEAQLLLHEPTPENEERNRREQEAADLDERTREILEKELRTLRFKDKGKVAVHMIGELGQDRSEVARALYLTGKTLRVVLCRACSKQPCVESPGTCLPGCVHAVGKQIWDEIIGRVISQLP